MSNYNIILLFLIDNYKENPKIKKGYATKNISLIKTDYSILLG